MRWVRNNRLSATCARQPLESVLHGQLDEKVGRRVSEHLDSCEACQERLTELAAEAEWWLDASRWLEPATADLDPCVDDFVTDTLDDFDATYPNNEHDLLESGLLDKSDNPAMVGTLGRYEIKRVIGAGGTGIVLQAIDTELNRTVAIKVLAPILAAHGPARKRFARESQAVAAVAHENVVAVHHVEGGGRVPYLVMQYIDGDSLQELVIREGPLDVTTTLRITAQLAAALTAAHDQGLVHRDVKPANILVGPVGQRVWMTDFGLARAVDDASLTRTGFIAGTPHYMSPEQARGATVRASSDLFGLGGVVYFMLTGRPPFRAERTLAILNRICTEPHRPVREVNANVPPQVARLVDRLLAKSDTDRFANAEAVRAECLQLLANETSLDEPVVILDDQPVASATISRRRFTAIRLLASTVVMALIACCLVAMIDLSQQLIVTMREKPALTDDAGDAQGDQVVKVNAAAASDTAHRLPQPFQAVERAQAARFVDSTPPKAFSAPKLSNTFGSDTNTSTIRSSGSNSIRRSSAPPSLVPHAPDPDPRPVALPNPSLDQWGSAPSPVTAPDRVSTTMEIEAVVWHSGLQEIWRQLATFESQVHQADTEVQSGSTESQPFDDTLHWMEATATELENAGVLSENVPQLLEPPKSTPQTPRNPSRY